MYPLFIPKDFISGTLISHGPFEGILAKPCLCGVACKEDEECVLIGTSFGDIYLMHAEHVPAGVLPSGEDEDESEL